CARRDYLDAMDYW
nr:immunoglobulin heavy chain junction region [Mus musculus]